MPQFSTNSFQVSENVGSVVDVLVQLFSADKSVTHVQRLILGRRTSDAEIDYPNLFAMQAGTNYVLRVTNVTKSNSTATFILTDDGDSTSYKQPNNQNVFANLAAGESVEQTVVVPAGRFNARLETSASISNSTPVVTSQVNGTNLNLIRAGNVVGSIPNAVSFTSNGSNTYTNPYHIATAFDWDWYQDGVVDGEVKIRFTFQNFQTPVQVKIDAGTFTTVNVNGLYFAWPANTTTTVIFKNGDNVEVSKTFNVGALPGTVPVAPVASPAAVTTDESIAVTFATGTFTLQVLRGGIVAVTVGNAQSPYNYSPDVVGNYTFKVVNSSGTSAASNVVNVTQGQSQTAPAAPTSNSNTGNVGTAISGTAAQNGTLLVFLNNGNQLATRTIAGNAWSYTPTVAGIYTFKVSLNGLISNASTGVNVQASANACNLTDEVVVAFWNLASADLVARTFDGGLTWKFGQKAEGKAKHFLTRVLTMLDRTDIEFRNGFTIAVKSCFTSAATGATDLSQYEMDTPAGYERYNQDANTFVFRPIAAVQLTIKVDENTANKALQLAWHTTATFSEVPESRWKNEDPATKTAIFTDAPATGTIYLFARNTANKAEEANTILSV
jgi:hypothetical protein